MTGVQTCALPILVRRQLRGEHGRVGSVEYTIYEKPQTPPPFTGPPDTASPCTGFPDTVKPDAVSPDADVPDTENPAQLNTKKTVETAISISNLTHPNP